MEYLFQILDEIIWNLDHFGLFRIIWAQCRHSCPESESDRARSATVISRQGLKNFLHVIRATAMAELCKLDCDFLTQRSAVTESGLSVRTTVQSAAGGPLSPCGPECGMILLWSEPIVLLSIFTAWKLRCTTQEVHATSAAHWPVLMAAVTWRVWEESEQCKPETHRFSSLILQYSLGLQTMSPCSGSRHQPFQLHIASIAADMPRNFPTLPSVCYHPCCVSLVLNELIIWSGFRRNCAIWYGFFLSTRVYWHGFPLRACAYWSGFWLA